jgi:hypothetical protein
MIDVVRRVSLRPAYGTCQIVNASAGYFLVDYGRISCKSLIEIVQVVSGAHPAFYSMGIEVLSQGISGRGVIFPNHLHLGPKLKMSTCLHGVDGEN